MYYGDSHLKVDEFRLVKVVGMGARPVEGRNCNIIHAKTPHRQSSCEQYTLKAILLETMTLLTSQWCYCGIPLPEIKAPALCVTA